jgi:hypothetical protein
MTVEEMTQEVSANIGGTVTDPTRLLRWVNWGVQNLSSYVLLDELLKTDAIAIAADATKITTIPSDLLGIVSIHCWDNTATDIVYKRLRKMKREFFPKTQNGQPTHYKRRGAEIITWPEADVAYTGTIEYVKIPAEVILTDTTELAPYWDVGIVMLATHYGFASVRRHEEASIWLKYFLGYSVSRKTDIDVSADMPQGGTEIAWDWDDISDDPPSVED